MVPQICNGGAESAERDKKVFFPQKSVWQKKENFRRDLKWENRHQSHLIWEFECVDTIKQGHGPPPPAAPSAGVPGLPAGVGGGDVGQEGQKVWEGNEI